MSDEDLAILRRCERCSRWRSIDEYKPLAHVCQWCIRTFPDLYGRHCVTRAILITEKGRAAIRGVQPAA